MQFTGETDANDIASFDNEEGTYTVHDNAVPEGHTEDETEYPVAETYGDVNITIESTG